MIDSLVDRLKELCTKNGTTLTALCKEITGSSGNLSTWKKGNIRTDYLAQIANKFSVSTDFILGLDKNDERGIAEMKENNIKDLPGGKIEEWHNDQYHDFEEIPRRVKGEKERKETRLRFFRNNGVPEKFVQLYYDLLRELENNKSIDIENELLQKDINASELSERERDIALAYRIADKKNKKIVDVTLEEYIKQNKQKSISDEAI